MKAWVWGVSEGGCFVMLCPDKNCTAMVTVGRSSVRKRQIASWAVQHTATCLSHSTLCTAVGGRVRFPNLITLHGFKRAVDLDKNVTGKVIGEHAQAVPTTRHVNTIKVP